MYIETMNTEKIKGLFSSRTLYGIPLRVSTDAPNDCIVVSPEVMREIQARGSTPQSRWTKSNDRQEPNKLVRITEYRCASR
jgi:hypothetical protein